MFYTPRGGMNFFLLPGIMLENVFLVCCCIALPLFTTAHNPANLEESESLQLHGAKESLTMELSL